MGQEPGGQALILVVRSHVGASRHDWLSSLRNPAGKEGRHPSALARSTAGSDEAQRRWGKAGLRLGRLIDLTGGHL